jgi:predicted phage tail protein
MATSVSVKAPWQSKTLVLNAILGVLAAVALFAPGALHISDWIASNGATVALIWSGASMLLRLVTKDAIQLGD